MQILRLLLILLVCLSFTYTEDEGVSYINNFSELAIVEMHRTGVPASIKLAQGLLESNYGTSELALEANNHFGIKCKRHWKGGSYYYKDDDKNARGQIIESCFRAYSSAVDSYVDHSNFLKFSGNYTQLFLYDRNDYKSWALGLKACGYATDPGYAQKLINKIEEYNLYQFDSSENPLATLSIDPKGSK